MGSCITWGRPIKTRWSDRAGEMWHLFAFCGVVYTARLFPTNQVPKIFAFLTFSWNVKFVQLIIFHRSSLNHWMQKGEASLIASREQGKSLNLVLRILQPNNSEVSRKKEKQALDEAMHWRSMQSGKFLPSSDSLVSSLTLTSIGPLLRIFFLFWTRRSNQESWNFT